MVINKTGNHHLAYGENGQDIAIQFDNNKCVCDGCGSGKHSEVGSKLFCLYLKKSDFNWDDAFSKLLSAFEGCSIEDIFNYLCFTILTVREDENNFYVSYCGDGYIIKQKHDNTFEFVKIDNGEYPHYYVYRFLDPKYTKGIQVEICNAIFSKSDFKNIGVATDGLRFIIDECEFSGNIIMHKELKEEFLSLLENGKDVLINRWINKNINFIKDDFSVVL